MRLPIELKKTWVTSLMIECPMGEATDQCPANEIRERELALSDLVEFVGKLTEDEIDEIIAHHSRCLSKREGPRRRRVS